MLTLFTRDDGRQVWVTYHLEPSEQSVGLPWPYIAYFDTQASESQLTPREVRRLLDDTPPPVRLESDDRY